MTDLNLAYLHPSYRDGKVFGGYAASKDADNNGFLTKNELGNDAVLYFNEKYGTQNSQSISVYDLARIKAGINIGNNQENSIHSFKEMCFLKGAMSNYYRQVTSAQSEDKSGTIISQPAKQGKKECDLLKELDINGDEVVSREEILEAQELGLDVSVEKYFNKKYGTEDDKSISLYNVAKIDIGMNPKSQKLFKGAKSYLQAALLKFEKDKGVYISN